MNELWTYVVATLSGGLGASAALWLGKIWLTARIKGDVETAYAKELERYKGEIHSSVQKELELHRSAIRAEADRSLEQMRAEVASARAVHDAAVAAFAASETAAIERRLKAVEDVWRATVMSRDVVGPHVLIYNILTRDEVAHARSDERTKRIIPNIAFDWLSKELVPLNRQPELLQPFVSEVLWALYFGYRTLLGRCVALLVIAEDRGTPIPFWLDDPVIRQLLSSLLNVNELRQVDRMQVGGFGKASALIEEKILAAARTAVSGQSSSEAALQNAREILLTVAATKERPQSEPTSTR